MQGSCLANFIIFRRGGAVFTKQIRHGAKRNLFRLPLFVRDLHLLFGRSKPLPYRLILKHKNLFFGMPRTSSPTVNIKIWL